MMPITANEAIPGHLPNRYWPEKQRELQTLKEEYVAAKKSGYDEFAREVWWDMQELDKKSRANAAAAEDGDGKDEKKEEMIRQDEMMSLSIRLCSMCEAYPDQRANCPQCKLQDAEVLECACCRVVRNQFTEAESIGERAETRIVGMCSGI